MEKQYGKFYTKLREVRVWFWHTPRLWLTYKINLFLLQRVFRYSRIKLRYHSSLGDTLRLTHIVRELRLRYPKIRITIATKWEALFRNNPNVFKIVSAKSRFLATRFDSVRFAKDSVVCGGGGVAKREATITFIYF